MKTKTNKNLIIFVPQTKQKRKISTMIKIVQLQNLCSYQIYIGNLTVHAQIYRSYKKYVKKLKLIF